MRNIVVYITLFFFFWTQTLAVAGPHEEGVAAGHAANPVIRGTVNQPSASAVVPGYTTTPPESAYYGQPNLSGRANARLADCALSQNDPVCEAQRGAMASANTPRPAVTAYDPNVAAAKEIARNPSLELGSLASYYSGCATTDVSAPATAKPRICHRYAGVGNFSCSRSLSVSVDRATSCAPGDWFAHAGSGSAGFDAQCLPDRPDTAQHFRVTQSGNPVAFFDVDLAMPRVFPQQVADLGLSAYTGMAGAPAHNRVWIADNSCTAATCTATALIAPDRYDLCTGGGGDSGPPSCTTVEPFKKRYAACPAGQQSGGNIQYAVKDCGDCDTTVHVLDDTQCYAPSASATPYYGFDLTGSLGATYYWNPAGPRTVIGWEINPEFPLPIPGMTLSYAKPATQFTDADRWDDQCPALASGGRCTLTSADVCVDGPATKRIDGKDVARACWKVERTFSCASGAPVDECAPLAASGCTPAASSCTQMNAATGVCEVFQDTYNCPVPAQTTTTASNCPNNVFCLGASCFNTSYTNDADFARSMSYMEAAREAGVYLDTDRMQVFKGEQNNCRDRLLKNCCYADGNGAGMTNQSMFGTGSRLVYDVLMNSENREFLYQGVQALLTSGGFSGSFTSYGVTVAVNGTALPAGSVTLFTGDSIAIAFDPWSLAIAVVIYIVMSMMSCNEEEGKLAMKEGAHLCHTIGERCSSCIRIFGKCVSCIEHTTSKCCFNSVLSRIVNEQGRIQVGKGWGGVENPDCSGFTIAQLQSLDFAAMDLTEFYASLVPSMPNVANIQSANAVRVAQLVANPKPASSPGSTQTLPSTPSPGPTPVPVPLPGPNPTPAPKDASVSPFGQNPALYASTFSEEFENGLNTNLWNDTIWYEGSNATKNYAVENGVLKIWPQRDANGQFFNRTLDTDGRYTQTYGYFEIEAKLPVGNGTWPAFWLFNHIGDRRPEIDIMEAYAGGAAPWGFTDANGVAHPQAYAPTIWKGDYEGQMVGTRQYDTGMDLSAGFHKYAVKWEPDKQTFYFDGKEVLSVNVTMSDPMYIMLDLWFGSASGTPDASTPTGKANSFEVNYVRAWEFK